MNREELNRGMDEWLDRAADEYGKAEIRPGFETRIIAKLNSRFSKSQRHIRWMPIAAAVAAILSVSTYLLHNQFQDRATTEIASERHTGSAAVPAGKIDFAGKPARRLTPSQLNAPIPEASTTGNARRQALPKAGEAERSRFLSSGLSDQERNLIAFVQALSKATSRDIPEKSLSDPMQITGMQIPEFQIRDFEISPFKIEALPITTPGSEEPL